MRRRIVAAMVGLLVGIAAIPAEVTLASFTDSESASVQAPITAATLDTISQLTCKTPLLGPISVSWKVTPGSLPTTAYQAVFTPVGSGEIVTKDLSGTGTEHTMSTMSLGILKSYSLRITATSSAAGSWNSLSTNAVTVNTTLLGLINGCS